MSNSCNAFSGTHLEGGYGLIAKNIMNDKTLDIEAKAIYSFICSWAGSDGDRAFPAVTTMCHYLNISEPRYYKYIKQLTDNDYIRIIPRRKENKITSNLYQVHFAYDFVSKQIVGTENLSTENIGTISNKPISNNNINKNYTEADEIINELNIAVGRNFKCTASNRKPILARLKEGFTRDDFTAVINNQLLRWKNTEWEKYLQPSTLFGNKMDGYLNMTASVKNQAETDDGLTWLV